MIPLLRKGISSLRTSGRLGHLATASMSRRFSNSRLGSPPRRGTIESDENRGGAVSVDYWNKWNRSAGCLQGLKSLRLDGAHARIWPASELRKWSRA
uniref:Uncharacterized protein n=2 Tax=Toxoplasma gondii TaxID=5811 RepID=A0A0F7V5P4_TOXGV|nr:TPA: hypothetical protein BN1205_066660 [Toxoplasma gondii VEG]